MPSLIWGSESGAQRKSASYTQEKICSSGKKGLKKMMGHRISVVSCFSTSCPPSPPLYSSAYYCDERETK